MLSFTQHHGLHEILFMLLRVAVGCSLSLKNSTSLCECITTYLSMLLLMVIFVVSSLGLF